jgi:hypothetical protein
MWLERVGSPQVSSTFPNGATATTALYCLYHFGLRSSATRLQTHRGQNSRRLTNWLRCCCLPTRCRAVPAKMLFRIVQQEVDPRYQG